MWIGAALLLVVGVSAMGFEIPGERQRLQAIGSAEGLPAILKRALDPGDGFEPVPTPGPHDWLAAHPEPGQSFEQFAGSKPNRPDRKRNVICLQPLGFCRKAGFDDEADWTKARLEWIVGPTEAQKIIEETGKGIKP